MPKKTTAHASAHATAPVRKAPRARASREETTALILDAAESLFAVRNPCEVTVRDIAEKAGVSHALVHQYVGTKNELLSAVVQRGAVDRAALARSSDTLNSALQEMFGPILTNRVHSKTLIRSAMDGVAYMDLKDRIATGQELLGLADRTAAAGTAPVEPPRELSDRVILAAITALLFGWVAIESWLWPLYELESMTESEIHAQIGEIVAYLTNLTLMHGDGITNG